MGNHYRIILASQSPRRRELLAGLGLSFEVISATGEEKAEAGTPAELVKLLAMQKAKEVYERVKQEAEECYILGSDTVVSTVEGEILGKPADAADASRMLGLLAGRKHMVSTGVCILHQKEGTCACETFVSETAVHMGPISKQEMDWYVATGEPMDKAGAYGIQGLGGRFVSHVEGDYYTIVGLPVHLVYRYFVKEGILPANFR